MRLWLMYLAGMGTGIVLSLLATRRIVEYHRAQSLAFMIEAATVAETWHRLASPGVCEDLRDEMQLRMRAIEERRCNGDGSL